jgi:hypothetical protein
VPDLSHVLTAAETTAAIALLRGLFVALAREPARALMNHYVVIKTLSRLWLKDKVYSGDWVIVWTGESNNFPFVNRDKAHVFKFLNSIAAEIESTTSKGWRIRYGFVGKIHDSIITGEWFDRRGAKMGYYGSFQIVMAKTLSQADGKWIGFGNNLAVNTGDLTWEKV